ncbi:MAG: hypothetical protein KDD94_12175, partial [Calditrichaeota bacterium]|nr:hypothetical protein [Calditrichota bacterium]
LFRHNIRWNTVTEFAIYLLVISMIGFADLQFTKWFNQSGFTLGVSKLLATALGVILNFTARKYVVFPEPSLLDKKFIQ